MIAETVSALNDITHRYCDLWQQQRGHAPASQDLYGMPSPCILASHADKEEVWWQPQSFTLAQNLQAVERALDIRLQPALTAFYTTQFAGDMSATWDGIALTLVQVWSEEDFARVQENLIGHLVMQRRLKRTPDLFIATTDSDSDIISVCNLSGEVILTTLGTAGRQVLAPSLAHFLTHLQPCMPD